MQSSAGVYSLQDKSTDILDLNLELITRVCGPDYRIGISSEEILEQKNKLRAYKQRLKEFESYEMFSAFMADYEDIIKEYDIFGVSLNIFWCSYLVEYLNRYIKSVKPGAKTLIGGAAVMDGYPDIAGSFLAAGYDMIINGDGREQLALLAEEKEPENCYSSIFKKEGTAFISSFKKMPISAPAFHKNLLAYPFPQIVSIPFNEGCYWGRCSFCYDKSYSGAVNYKKYPDEMLARQMLEMKAAGVPLVFLAGSGIKKKELKELLRTLNKHGEKIPRFCFECRCFEIDEELAHLMAASQIGKISFGMESPDEEICNDIFNKGISIKGFRRGLELLDKLEYRRISVNITMHPLFTRQKNLEAIAGFVNSHDCLSDYIVYFLEIPHGTGIEEEAAKRLGVPLVKALDDDIYNVPGEMEWLKKSLLYLAHNAKKPFSLYSDSGTYYQMCCLADNKELAGLRERYYNIHLETLDTEFFLYNGPGDLG